MTLKEAQIEAEDNGEKITHRYYSTNEYLYFKNGCYYTEDNCNMTN